MPSSSKSSTTFITLECNFPFFNWSIYWIKVPYLDNSDEDDASDDDDEDDEEEEEEETGWHI
jgi:hypothetical protein